MDLEEAKRRRNALRREQYAIDGGKRRAENQAWKDAHREQVREAGRQYQRLRRAADPEKARAEVKEWRKNHPEKAKEMRDSWYSKNGKEYYRKWSARDRKTNPSRYMWRNCQNRAKKLGVPFDLIEADLTVPEVCPVLGIKLEMGARGFEDNSPSADRLKPELGYVKNNVRIISWRANAIKRDATLDELRKIVAYMERETCP